MLDGFNFIPGHQTKMIKYFNPYVDDMGFTHSIDNIVCWYYLNTKIEKVLDIIHDMRDSFLSLDYWEKLDLKPCVKYDYYLHHIHFGDIFIKLGRYRENKGLDKNGRRSLEYNIIDCMRIEVNPNKHYDTKEWLCMMSLVEAYAADGFIDKYDYAVDIPLPPDKVVVTKTRKTPGLYNGTRYFGKRNQHGFVKIYDKYTERLREAKLIAKKFDIHFSPEDYYYCTRVETTLKNNQKYSGIEYAVISSDILDSMDSLTPTARMYVELLQDIVRLGGDPEPHLQRMNYRTRVAVEPFIHGSLVYIPFRDDILRSLLDELAVVFHVKDIHFSIADAMDVEYESSDFVSADDDFIPFSDSDLLPDIEY